MDFDVNLMYKSCFKQNWPAFDLLAAFSLLDVMFVIHSTGREVSILSYTPEIPLDFNGKWMSVTWITEE